MYDGDIRLGDTIDVKFCTAVQGVPTALSGGTVAAYPANSTTEITAGITLTADLDSRTGLNNVRIVATSGNGYLTATNYTLVLTAGTVGGATQVGMPVGAFSIECRSALMPTTAARTALVAADGSVSPNWADVKSPTTAVALTNTTIAVTQKVDIETIKTNPVVNGGTITFPTTATLASTTNITAGTIATVTNLTNAPTNGDLTAAMKASVNAEADTAILDAALVSKIDTIDDFLDTEVAATLAAVDTEVGDIKAKTDKLSFNATNQVQSDMLRIKNTIVNGDGAGTPWGP